MECLSVLLLHLIYVHLELFGPLRQVVLEEVSDIRKLLFLQAEGTNGVFFWQLLNSKATVLLCIIMLGALSQLLPGPDMHWARAYVNEFLLAAQIDGLISLFSGLGDFELGGKSSWEN
jgi:hypothetical protein